MSEKNYYHADIAGKWIGPISLERVTEFIKNQAIRSDTLISLNGGKACPASLLFAKHWEKLEAMARPASPTPPPPPPPRPSPRNNRSKSCRFCDELISVNAIKCKHCGSMLTGQEPPPRPVALTASTGSESLDRTLGHIGQRARGSIRVPIVMAMMGIATGCLVGFFAAHYFAFFGGLALIGRPFSPARFSLVPGHMLLCGIILGAAGFAIGFLFRASEDSNMRVR
jgi:hypothetical protein